MESENNLDQGQATIDRIVNLNEQLEEKTISNANYAFNLGCFIGIIPAVLIVVAGFFITGRSWLAAVIIAVLMGMGLMLFANFVAHTARERTLVRVFSSEIKPELVNLQDQSGFDEKEFNRLIDQALPAGAPLRNFTLVDHDSNVQEDTEPNIEV